MTDADDTGRDPHGGDRDVQPGGRSSRGPNPQPGGVEEPGGLVPPYEERTGSNTHGDPTDAGAEAGPE